jgi:CMP-N,N'-diacetyllegionaminic acid synthase
MKTLAIIPARAGSQRVPAKNTRLLGGQPLIRWSINVAKQIPTLTNILVTTDDLSALQIAKDSGVLAPWLRPSHLSTASSSTSDVLIHALEWYENEYGAVDAILLLQPTSPFRTKASIEQALMLFDNESSHAVISVSTVNQHPSWAFQIKDGLLTPYQNLTDINLRSQELSELYIPNGSIYLVDRNQFLIEKNLYLKQTNPLIIESPVESIDIDSEWDFTMAEILSSHFAELRFLNCQ